MRIILQIIFILTLLSPFSKCIEERSVEIIINKENNPNRLKTIGIKGTFGLITDYYNDTTFNKSDIEETTEFIGYFRDNADNEYNWTCRLWAPEDQNIVVLCNTGNDLMNNSDYIRDYKLIEGRFYYEDVEYIIRSDDSFFFRLHFYPLRLPFIYSDPQIIDLD